MVFLRSTHFLSKWTLRFLPVWGGSQFLMRIMNSTELPLPQPFGQFDFAVLWHLLNKSPFAIHCSLCRL